MSRKVIWIGTSIGLVLILVAPIVFQLYHNSTSIYMATAEIKPAKVTSMSLSQAWERVSSGDLAIVNASVLKDLGKMLGFKRKFPFIATFDTPGYITMYAVTLIHDESVFIYAEPAGPQFSIEDFKKRAYEAFKVSLQDFVRSYKESIELNGGKHWTVTETANTSSSTSPVTGTHLVKTEETSSTGNAYIAGFIYWNSNDTWAPYVRFKLAYRVYKLQDVDADNDYYVVVQHTEAYPGYYLYYNQHDSNYGYKWEIDKVKNYFNTDYDTQNVFTLLYYKPDYNLDYYNDKESHTITYTIGTGGISISVSYQLRSFKLSINSTGYDWAEWITDLNRESYHGDGVGREPITVEPSYLFALNLNQLANHGQASQRLFASIDMTGNNVWWPDDYWQGTVYITWTWYG